MKRTSPVIFEDDHIVVINKPSDLLVLPDRYNENKPNLLGYLKKKHDPLYVVHRLDRETSGIILFAKSEDAHRKLSMDFEHRRVDKYYYCLVDGRWGKDQTVDMGIESHASKKRMKVSPKGKSAISHFKLLEKFDKWSLLEVQIETGRTHQIRVHAQHLGYPIVADPLYNTGTPLTIHQIKKNSNKSKGEVVPLISRTALHAERVSLIHPITDETLSLAAPLPKDFRAALNQLRKWATIQ